jgi:CRISPR-associated protein Csx17
MPELLLNGCTPEPLRNYLKALGVLRLVGEQDSQARGCWFSEVFVLHSKMFTDRETLVKFFLNDYKPTPIVVPWSGNDFFAVNWTPDTLCFSKTPTGPRVVEAILATSSKRFASYRDALHTCRLALAKIVSKEEMSRQKWEFITHLRSTASETLVDWIDCAAVVSAKKFAPLLGSGGGSDGNTHFSDNFMQNLWDVLPDFDVQRGGKGSGTSIVERSRQQLENCLYGDPTRELVSKRTSSLYDSGAVGGPNATQGMERESLSNPWNVVLALEGCVGFAAAAVNKLPPNAEVKAGYPFQMKMSPTQQELADKEEAGSEIWLPLWSRLATWNEVQALLREGRAEYGGRKAKSGVDMARAVSALGVDRGIRAFQRYAIVKGRVGGENYNTAALLGEFPVIERRDADLIRQLDDWLDRYRSACVEQKNVPLRFKAALRRIDEAIFAFCRYGGVGFFQSIVIALGHAESALALSAGKIDKRTVSPITGLTSDWVRAANDNSWEFEVALALAGIQDHERKIGPLRCNLEPVEGRRGKDGALDWKWAEKERAVVWNSASLPANLAAVLRRRFMDGERNGCTGLPLSAPNFASISAISRFLAGELDPQRIEDLLWGLMSVRQSPCMLSTTADKDAPPLPRAYALLKLLFLPEPLTVNGLSIAIKPEPSIVNLLIAGRVGEACQIAMRRLRASGLSPLPHPRTGGAVRDSDWKELDCLGADGVRLAAALLLPISHASINHLRKLVIREPATEFQIP